MYIVQFLVPCISTVTQEIHENFLHVTIYKPSTSPHATISLGAPCGSMQQYVVAQIRVIFMSGKEQYWTSIGICPPSVVKPLQEYFFRVLMVWPLVLSTTPQRPKMLSAKRPGAPVFKDTS